MHNYEKEYYESKHFWEGESLLDEWNTKRFLETVALLPKSVKSLADIGCGNGLFLNFVHKERPEIELIGVDRSNAALEHVKFGKAQGDIAAIPLADHSYDCVTCLEVIEHLPVTIFENALSELTRVSRDYIVISVPFAEVLEENYTKCPRCKSSFNADLHLRNFSDNDMRNLLSNHGFEFVDTRKTGERIRFKGHYKFRKMFHASQFEEWRSPICPICGYKTPERILEDAAQQDLDLTISQSGFASYFTWLPKLFWPKEKRFYWIICLYKRKNQGANYSPKNN